MAITNDRSGRQELIGPTRPTAPPRGPVLSRTHLAWGSAIGAAIVVIVLFFVFIFQWNWLRQPLANEISGHLHRPVAIKGDLVVRPWSWTPTATLNGLVIGNPTWAGAAPMATLPQLTVSISLPDLLRGKLILPLVAAAKPDIHLVRQPDGRANWDFSSGSSGQPLKLPPIRRLNIDNGSLRIDDAQRKLVFVGHVTSNEAINGPGKGVFNLTGNGVLNQAPFTALITGGALLDVDPDRPYPFSANVRAGATHIIASGAVVHPFDLGQMNGQVRISGEDLAKLYDLSGLALPSTPPYDLSAGFSRVGRKVSFTRLHGTVGESDLAGALAVDNNTARPLITADLSSQRLRLADLAAVIGGGPRHMTGRPVSPAQAAMAAKLNAEHRLLPDEHLAVTRVRATDARVTYRAEVVQSGAAPIRGVYMKVRLDHGVLAVDPLEMTLPQGALTGTVRIDARPATPVDTVDLRLTGAQIAEFIGRGSANPPAEGALVARARLTGYGDSVRAAAASSDGSFTVVIPHGQIRQSLAELMGIDATKGLFLLLTKNESQTPIRCAVADFHAKDGVLTSDRIMIDTGVVLATGSGDIDLRDESLNLRLNGKPKKFRLIHIGAPITLTGDLEKPRIGVDFAKAAPQVGIAALLGVFVAPAAVLLPFVDPNLAHDADCNALLSQASAQGAPVKSAH